MASKLKKRVLVVEDHPNWQNVIRELLQEVASALGYSVQIVVARSFAEASDYIATTSFDCVTVDNELLEGTMANKLLDRIARLDQRVPVVVVSGVVDPGDVRDFFKNYGIEEFFWKRGFSPKEFKQTLASLLVPTKGARVLDTILGFFAGAGFDVEELSADEYLLRPQGEDHPQASYSPLYTRFIAGRPPTGDDFTAVCEATQQHYGDDLTHRVALVISDQRPEPWARYRLYEIRQREGLAVVPLDISLFRRIKPSRTASDILAAEIDQASGQQNLYAISVPVSDDLSFFGRERVLQKIIYLLNTGQPVGIFGLRKVGKTSLLQRLQGRLAPQRPTALVDLQGTAREQGVWPLYPAIVAAFATHLHRYRPDIFLPDLRLYPKPGPLSPAMADAFLEDLRTLHTALGQPGKGERLLLMVDEIDRLFRFGKTPGYEGFSTFLGSLRAANQQMDCLDFLVVGVDPMIRRRERWQNRDMELYQILREIWMPPMAPRAVREMIESMGSQMGVRYGAEALQLLTQVGGGQPFVIRQMCSRAVEGRLGKGVIIITADQAQAAVQEFVSQDSYLAELWRTRLDGLQREMLLALARTPDPIPLSRLLPLAQRQDTLAALGALENYTLVRRDEERYVIAWGVLRKWIRWVVLGLEA